MEIVTRTHKWYTILPLTAILVYLLTLTGYWQLIFGAGVLAGLLMKRARAAFLTAAVGGAIGWGAPPAVASLSYPLDAASALLIDLLGLPASLFILPLILTILISAFVTGLGSLLGAYGYLLARSTPPATEGP